ncbi:MAG: hypothetical protein A2X25_10425 [Chloroflexi bacterium GWB2_49_20]|nr:MAG: hypothetical protein A2X25_10425 [Chloroflexi bacterium GWB2_49_20]OGN79022.1 MAG: hypothetical protein A2X26_00935 [Chloroflexi bacterium GWC2_49_37]OGN86218.1 MAG: hypothetical protein A2X27_04850 [Chloroflexi bacterium GWD2_49_16]
MSIKLIMTWDIAPENEQDYFEFVISEFIPGVQRLGLEPVEAWATIYGNYPQIQVGMLANDLSLAQRALRSTTWQDLQQKLFSFVKNFSYKLVPARSGFQL